MTDSKSSALGIAALSAGIAVLYVGSTVPTPLYPLYRDQFDFSEFTVTAIYAIYAIGNLAVLFLFGRLSDQIGRGPVALSALCLSLVSSSCFLIATAAPWLFVARVLNGLAAGLGAGALTAWFAELLPNRASAASIAASANLAGLAVGALIAGALAQYAPAPLRLSWIVHLAMIVATIFLIRTVPETIASPRRHIAQISFRPRIGVPSGLRLAFLPPAVTAFAAFALGGFYAALVPGVLGDELHERNLFVVGATAATFFGAACVTALAAARWRSRTAVLSALSLYLPSLILLITAERTRSMTLLTLASVIAGTAMALGYRGSLQAMNELAPQDRRAEVLSSYLIACYSGNAVPVIGVGLLALAIGAPGAHTIFAAVLVSLALLALVVELRIVHK